MSRCCVTSTADRHQLTRVAICEDHPLNGAADSGSPGRRSVWERIEAVGIAASSRAIHPRPTCHVLGARCDRDVATVGPPIDLRAGPRPSGSTPATSPPSAISQGQLSLSSPARLDPEAWTVEGWLSRGTECGPPLPAAHSRAKTLGKERVDTQPRGKR